MMQRPFAASIPASRHMKFGIPSEGTAPKAFSFESRLDLTMALTFPPQPLPPRPMKRCRPVADVDGEHSCVHKKKRRLRRFLITSRLSPQFSHPATNIVDRGHSKIAVWAKQKSMGRNLLHKAAILNRIRRQATCVLVTDEAELGKMIVDEDRTKERFRLTALSFKYGSHNSFTRPGVPLSPPLNNDGNSINDRKSLSRSPSRSRSPSGSPSPELLAQDHDSTVEYRSPNDAYFDSSTSPRSRPLCRSYLPLPPSPLGLSNYDAFDQEDEVPDPYAHLDDGYDDNEDQEEDTDLFTLSPSSHPPNRISYTDVTTSPVHSIYSDFSILNPDEPVFGDYDRVDEGSDAIWPTQPGSEQPHSTSAPLSSSPDFPTLFATIATTAAAAQVPQTSSLPNLTSLALPAVSPNFSSPPLPPATNLATTTSSSSTITTSPTLVSLPPINEETALGTKVHEVNSPKREHECEYDEERQRQKKVISMRFGL